MARETKGTDAVDVDSIRQLLELMEKFDVREFKLQRGDVRYVLRRGPQEFLTSAPAMFGPPSPMPALPAAAAPAPAPAAAENLLQVKSPTVGTFYTAPSPGDAAFVKVGDAIKPDTIVCIVEAMKVFNQIPAGVSGTVAKILLTDGDAVEFGQPLLLVKP
jgi:acetyl-CoA carboxylase biotin carboxyl carrier protein